MLISKRGEPDRTIDDSTFPQWQAQGWVEKSTQSTIAAPDFAPGGNYEAGQLVWLGGALYRAKAAFVATDTFNADNWAAAGGGGGGAAPAVVYGLFQGTATQAEIAAGLPVQVGGVGDGPPAGWTTSEDGLSVFPPVGAYMVALSFSIDTAVVGDVAEIDVLSTGNQQLVSVFADPSQMQYGGGGGAGGPLLVATAGTDGFQVVPGYSNNEPSAGSLPWALTVWRIGDLPA